MKMTRLLLLWLGVTMLHGALHAAEVRNIEVRNIKITSSDLLEVFVSFRTAADEPTIQLVQDKLTTKIDELAIPKNDIKIKSFADSDQGLSVLIALDLSGSMTKSLPTLKQELKKYIGRLRPGKDFVAIGIIGDNWKLALDFTSDIEQASSFIDQLQGASQTTALFESIFDGVRLLSRKGSDLPVRRSMIVLSDGMNEKAGRTAAQCIDMAKQNFIEVHSLIFLPTQSARVFAAKGELEVISKDTGGITHTALTAEQIGEGVDKLTQEMANEIVMSIPVRHIPSNGISHTLGINYDNFSKKVPFVISENELAKLKSLPSPKVGHLREKIWLYIPAGLIALLVIGFFIWRRSRKNSVSRSPDQDGIAATPPDSFRGNSELNIPVVPVAETGSEVRDGVLKTGSVPKPSARKTEYRAPGSDRSVSKLLLIQGGTRNETFHLDGNQIFVGANDNNDIWLDMPSVSGRHAVLTRTATGFAIADLNSTNGTYINGSRIHQDAVELLQGQEVRLGLVVLRAE